MKILVVSGFLGAGKTTFIKELIQKSGTTPVVLENEFGDNSIDSAAIQEGSDLQVMEFMEGCVCCTQKDTFSNTILAISSSLDPEYLVVEPTGVAKLSNIIQNIHRVSYERIRLMKSVVILSPASFDRNRQDFPDIYEDQIRYADIICFSKLKASLPEEVQRVKTLVREMNPKAEIVDYDYRDGEPIWWKELMRSEADSHFLEEEKAAPSNMAQISITDVKLSDFGELIKVLEDTLRGKYGNIPRAKGYLTIGEETVRFDLADGMYAMIGSNEADVPKQCVFIGTKLKERSLRRSLHKEGFQTGLRRINRS